MQQHFAFNKYTEIQFHVHLKIRSALMIGIHIDEYLDKIKGHFFLIGYVTVVHFVYISFQIHVTLKFIAMFLHNFINMYIYVIMYIICT